MTELKPCPFCSGPAVERLFLPEGDGTGLVGCFTTECPMEDAEVPIDKWNHRTSADTKPSSITYCYFHQAVGKNALPLFSDGGSVCVQLHRYAILPLEVFHDADALAKAIANAKVAADRLKEDQHG